MRLFYAMGGGLGHLSRCQALIHTLGLQGQDFRLLSPSPRAAELFDSRNVIPPPPSNDPSVLRRFWDDLIRNGGFEEIYLDVFPAGILGELAGWEGASLHLIGRHLKWEEYKKRVSGPFPSFSRVYGCEELPPELLEVLRYEEQVPLELRWPPFPTRMKLPEHTWLVVHSGPEEEVRALHDYARRWAIQQRRNPPFTIIGDPGLDPAAFPGAEMHSFYPAWPLFAQAEMVITAGGFNSMSQMKGMKEKHVCLPFFRELDDQGRRVSHHFPRPSTITSTV